VRLYAHGRSLVPLVKTPDLGVMPGGAIVQDFQIEALPVEDERLPVKRSTSETPGGTLSSITLRLESCDICYLSQLSLQT